jgi:hypothetical protein
MGSYSSPQVLHMNHFFRKVPYVIQKKEKVLHMNHAKHILDSLVCERIGCLQDTIVVLTYSSMMSCTWNESFYTLFFFFLIRKERGATIILYTFLYNIINDLL